MTPDVSYDQLVNRAPDNQSAREDGLLLVLGILASLVALAISLTIIFFGYQTYLYLKGLILGAKGASGIMFSVAGARLYS